MGVKVAIVQKGKNGEVPEIAVPQRELASVVSTGAGKLQDKQQSHRRKGTEKNVLDDIMGDPEDFRDLVESDAESDGGRWEDVARSCQEVVLDESGRLLNGEIEEHDSKETNRVKACGKEGLMTITAKAVSLKEQGDVATKAVSLKEQGSKGSGGKHGLEEEEKIQGGAAEGKLVEGQSGMRVRYFIIKSLNHENLTTSYRKGVWATQAMNERILNEAYESADKVILIFSVNMSGHFQGYAQMSSPIGRRKEEIWSESNMGANPWGGTFRVEWLCLYDLPFQKTVHLKNPLNSFKPVKISRDGQELTVEIGEALCALIDEGAEKETKAKRRLALNNALLAKKQRLEMGDLPLHFPSSTFNEAYDLQMGTTIATRSMHGLHGSTSLSHEQIYSSKSSLPTLENDSERRRDHHKERDRKLTKEKDPSCIGGQSDSINLPPEEDLLNMTYEEYLERHHGKRSTQHQGAAGFSSFQTATFHGTSWFGTVPSMMGYSDTGYLNSLSSLYSSQQGSIAPGDSYFSVHGAAKSFHG